VKINVLDMKKKLEDYDLHASCPIRNVLDRFGDKWSILVILLLGEHKTAMRFNEVAQTIGDISQKMLTVTLRTLEADGMVMRKHYPEIPPRVEYELTELGKSLLPHINGLAQWAVKNYDTITKSRKKFIAKKQLVS
jgi:DNA-binding HxlR family transcriptional regulator